MILREIGIESFAVTDMTAKSSAVLFRSESKAAVYTPMNALKIFSLMTISGIP